MKRSEGGCDDQGICRPEDDLIFSLAEGFVWASWPGTRASVKLGIQTSVTAVMRDFLAQCELGERLAKAKRVEK